MMVRAFEPLDLHRLRLKPDTPTLEGWQDRGADMLAAGPCWSAVQDGAVLACAGFVLHWRGRASCWCLISADFPTAGWPWLHKQVLRRMNEAQHALGLIRIEAEALYGWLPGGRWLRMLGFDHEGVMRAYGHDGRDYSRWARIA